jgi:hypothetical protein
LLAPFLVALSASLHNALNECSSLPMIRPTLPLRFPPCLGEQRVGMRFEIRPTRVPRCGSAIVPHALPFDCCDASPPIAMCTE